jgi:hypothetical protein
MESPKLVRCVFAMSLALFAPACTAGYITDNSGNPYSIGVNTEVKLISSTNAYYANAWTLSGDTVFSFDPNAPTKLDPNGPQNTSEVIPADDYFVYVESAFGEVMYQNYGKVRLGNYAACPFNDYFTSKSTDCQLLQLMVYPNGCFEGLPKPYQNGNVFVIPMAQHSCD